MIESVATPQYSTWTAYLPYEMSTLCLIDLPAEILEQILLRLPGQDLVKMEVV